MERLLKAREEASQKEKEKGKETEYNLVDTDFLGPEDIPLSSYETLSDRDDVSCITNPTFAGGMYLREFSEDTASKTNLSEQFEPNFQALSSNSTRSSGENDVRLLSYSQYLRVTNFILNLDRRFERGIPIKG